jgi:hypothetical protein
MSFSHTFMRVDETSKVCSLTALVSEWNATSFGLVQRFQLTSWERVLHCIASSFVLLDLLMLSFLWSGTGNQLKRVHECFVARRLNVRKYFCP